MQSMRNSEKRSRRSIRLKGYDYTSTGAYFITICAYRRQRLFGKVVDGVMSVNEWGAIAASCWQEIPQHFPNAQLDEFVIMPNHIHGIVVIRRHGTAVPSSQR